MNRLIKTIVSLIIVSVSVHLHAQPFAKEIAAYKKQDSIAPPPANAILFVGSSSFRLWNNIANDFSDYSIINRGFGGSAIPDVIQYADEIIFPYLPKQIVIYCGENDIASSDTVSGQTVSQRFKQLFVLIRSRLPKVPILFVSIKPSPSRWQMKDRMITANELIKKYLKKQKQSKYINVWNAMLGIDGNPKPDIFISDNLHMNVKGYAIWQKIIEPYLKK